MVNNESVQYSDLNVTKQKWDKEIGIFKKNQGNWKSKGVLLLNEEFPNLELLFLTHRTNPVTVPFGVRINFDNYDTEPPSVKFINPITGILLKRREIPFQFIKLAVPEGISPDKLVPQQLQPQDLLQGLPDMEPFLCIPGIREYHRHPRHTGDSWFLYRGKGEGCLGFILDQLYTYSTSQIQSLQVNLNIGFQVQPRIEL